MLCKKSYFRHTQEQGYFQQMQRIKGWKMISFHDDFGILQLIIRNYVSMPNLIQEIYYI